MRVGRLILPADALRVQYSRASGPGGQNVNKLSTRAEIWVKLDAIQGLDDAARARLIQMAGKRLTAAGEIHLADQTTRSQQRNTESALERLRQMLAACQRAPKVRRPTKISRAAKRRRVDAKKHRGEIKRGRRNVNDI
jgi:ribosome-associated protein